MKKHLIVIGLVFVLLMVGFSGCTEQQTSDIPDEQDTIKQNIPPTCSITPTTTSARVGDVIGFRYTVNDSDGYISEAIFDFDDGITIDCDINDFFKTHTFTSTGSKRVQIIVWDNDGAKHRDYCYIEILEELNPYEDSKFMSWLEFEKASFNVYATLMVDELKKGVGRDSERVKDIAESQKERTERSIKEANEFDLSYGYDKIRDEWVSNCEDIISADIYTITSEECIILHNDYKCSTENLNIAMSYLNKSTVHINIMNDLIDDL
ncbi:MAG: hypothetical protein KAJ21_05735 [Thermoplasmatales archaeon]|nr:hypothetical protein [Thermoplasmatales archaeon]